jgi:hypothetical protein
VKSFQALTFFRHSSEHLIYAKVELQENFLLIWTLEQRFLGVLSLAVLRISGDFLLHLQRENWKRINQLIARNTGLFVMKLPDNKLLSSLPNYFSILKIFYLTWLYPETP